MIQIIGMGKVGSTIASMLLLKNYDIIITDINKNKLYAEYYDLKVLLEHLKNDYSILTTSKQVEYADFYIICCGLPRKQGQKKIELLDYNWKEIEPIIKDISKTNIKAWVLIVTNPSTILAQKSLDYIPKVIPMGLFTDIIENNIKQIYGMHENNKEIDIGEFIFKNKGYTNFGIAGEVLNIINNINEID